MHTASQVREVGDSITNHEEFGQELFAKQEIARGGRQSDRFDIRRVRRQRRRLRRSLLDSHTIGASLNRIRGLDTDLGDADADERAQQLQEIGDIRRVPVVAHWTALALSPGKHTRLSTSRAGAGNLARK
mgnify:CR=1 FL=1